MSSFTLFLSLLNGLLSLVVVAGLLSRGRSPACRLLPVYLVAGVAMRAPYWFWPERFYQWDYWFLTQCVHTALRLALAAELARRALAALPRGLERARLAQLLILLGTLAALVVAPRPEAAHAYYFGALLAGQATYAGGWLFVAFLATVWYHRIPTDRLHRDVALGFALWALVAGISPYLEEIDGVVGLCNQLVASLVYPGVLMAWARTAWVPDAQTALSPASLAALRPWRA